MISRKYVKDYQIEERFDEKGRVRTQAVYTGVGYTLSPPVTKRDKIAIIILSAVSVVLFIAALIPETFAARVVYIMLPFALTALPLFIMTSWSVRLLVLKEPMDHAIAERLANRMPAGAIAASILPGITFIATIITITVTGTGVSPGDVMFICFSPLITAASATVFAKTRRLKATPVITRSTCI